MLNDLEDGSEEIRSSFVHSSVKEENKLSLDLEMKSASKARLSVSHREFEMIKRKPVDPYEHDKDKDVIDNKND